MYVTLRSSTCSSSKLLILRRTNFITTASGILTLCKQPCSMHVESGLRKKLLLNFQISNLMYNSFIFQQYVCYITLLNMFRAARCTSSGGQIVSPQPLVSSPSVNSRTVCRWRADCSPLSTCILYGCLWRVTIPEAVVIQFVTLPVILVRV